MISREQIRRGIQQDLDGTHIVPANEISRVFGPARNHGVGQVAVFAEVVAGSVEIMDGEAPVAGGLVGEHLAEMQKV